MYDYFHVNLTSEEKTQMMTYEITTLHKANLDAPGISNSILQSTQTTLK